MNPYFTAAIQAIKSIGPGLKSWIFSDGKFNAQRAIILVVVLVALVFAAKYVGPENLEHVTDALEEVSDVIGHEN